MTTGRINQVTILTLNLAPEGYRVKPNPPKRVEVVILEGPEPRLPGQPVRVFIQLRNEPPQVIQLPPMSSPRRGPPQSLIDFVKVILKTATYTPQEEDTVS